ncbi:MAG: fluoride efflux transporter CrcB [Pseudomonadales bacterium]
MSMLPKFLMVATGGAFGAMARYAVSLWVPVTAGFPWATFIVNVLGSLLIGIAYVVLVEKAAFPPFWRDLLVVGFLGAFTTFSTFSIETVGLIQNHEMSVALVFVVSSLFFCIVAAVLGMSLARIF